MAGTREPTWPRFPSAMLGKLFDAVNVNDRIDPRVALPEPVVVSCPDDMVRRCYALCLHFWEEGVVRKELLRLVKKLLRDQTLTVEERTRYKQMRARYKHLRFAQRLYSAGHESHASFDRTTRHLGQLQDAFRTGQRERIVRYGRKLRLRLSSPMWFLTQRAARRTRLDTGAGVEAFQKREMLRLKETIGRAHFAGEEFHATRKIVSMHVCHYDTRRSLEPNDHDERMSRFLAMINGLMGARHDEMVTEAACGRYDYDAPAPLPHEIRSRLETLVARHPLPCPAAHSTPEEAR